MISCGVLITVYLDNARRGCLANVYTPIQDIQGANLQLDDVRVSEELQVLDFPLDPAGHVPADELLPRNDLQGNLLVRHAVHGQLDLAKGALAEGLDDVVGADTLLGLLLRSRLNGSVLAAILVAASAGIGRLVLGSAVGRRSERDLQLAVLVGAVGHHRGVVVAFLEMEGGIVKVVGCPTTMTGGMMWAQGGGRFNSRAGR